MNGGNNHRQVLVQEAQFASELGKIAHNKDFLEYINQL